MNLAEETGVLLKKEAMSEWRTRSSIQAILMYALSTVFICYWAIHRSEPSVWNALFWIILVFASINAAAKSFMQESQARQLYLYTLASPEAILLSKIIFNSVIMVFLAGSSLALYSLLMGFPVILFGRYMVCVMLGSLNLAALFTLLSAIASRAGNNMTLLSILGIPLALPILYILLHYSASALVGAILPAASLKDLVALIMLLLVTIIISLLVFPYIWRD